MSFSNYLGEFLIVAVTILMFGVWFVRRARDGWGVPAIAVLLTAGVWYLGDVAYNVSHDYQIILGPEAVESAWLQFWLFVVAFGVMVGPISRRINRKFAGRTSRVLRIVKDGGITNPIFQKKIDVLVQIVCMVWVVLMLIALVKVEGDIGGLVAPYLGHRVDPWSRDRLGGGFDALLSFAGYIQLFCAAASGALFSLARRPSTRIVAGIVASLAIPFFVFSPRRNIILTAIIPAVLSWVLFRIRGPVWFRALWFLPFFACIHLWFGFIISNRSKMSIAEAFSERDGVSQDVKSEHRGLNMFEELVWINGLREQGIFDINWGTRYLAELSNPIPRAIWPGKPTIGLDYAVARGYGSTAGDESEGGVVATVSTGMIGQGVTNFGGFFGPIAAALLMSLWASLLARLDLGARDPGQLILYLIGLILTFNLGRDINLLTTYPMIFGLLIISIVRRMKGAGLVNVANSRRNRFGSMKAKARIH